MVVSLDDFSSDPCTYTVAVTDKQEDPVGEIAKESNFLEDIGEESTLDTVDEVDRIGDIIRVVTKEMPNENSIRQGISKKAIETEYTMVIDEGSVNEDIPGPAVNIISPPTPPNGAVLKSRTTYRIYADFCEPPLSGITGTTKAELYINDVLVRYVSANEGLVWADFWWTTPRSGTCIIQVIAYNDVGISAESGYWTFTVGSTEKPRKK